MPTTALARALRGHRAAHGLSQKALAGELGVTQATISKWERGELRRGLSSRNVLRLATVLGRSVDDVVGMFEGDDDPDDIEGRLAALEAGGQGLVDRFDRVAAQLAQLRDLLELVAGKSVEELLGDLRQDERDGPFDE